ncbi:hypothetical protein D3C75_740110 [compost metagenome]
MTEATIIGSSTSPEFVAEPPSTPWMKIGIYTEAAINAAPLNKAHRMLEAYSLCLNRAKEIIGSLAFVSANRNSTVRIVNAANNPRISAEFQAYSLPPSSSANIKLITAPSNVPAPSQSMGCFECSTDSR